MASIRDRMKDWSKTTYTEALDIRVRDGTYPKGPAFDLTKRVLQNQRIAQSTMSGHSTSGLRTMEDEVGAFRYVKVFNTMSQLSNWSPADMVYGVCKMATSDPKVMRDIQRCAEKWEMTEEELITKMCGRALRAMPSYIREHDLREQLERKFRDAEFRQDETLDTVLHADLMMERQGEKYYFWSYVATGKSLSNFHEKLLGQRAGHVPDGKHITCPFSLKLAEDIDGWKLYDADLVRSIANTINKGTTIDYDRIGTMLERNDHYFVDIRMIDKHTDRDLLLTQHAHQNQCFEQGSDEIEEDVDFSIGNR